MKKILLQLLFLLPVVAFAQADLSEYYYLPKTEAFVRVEYEVVEQTRGQFYQYAERYLGTKDAVLEDKTEYRLVGVNLLWRTAVDKSKAYKVDNQNKKLQYYFSKSQDGLLQYVGNMPKDLPQTEHKHCGKCAMKQADTAASALCLLPPLMEDQMRANSVAKMAEGVAKQIYSIRESRLNLLAGEVEHVPQDGDAMRQVLEELNRQEAALTELFMGKKSVKMLHKDLAINLSEELHEAEFLRFSKYAGVVAADDLSGEPIYLSVGIELPKKQDVEQKKKMALSPFFIVEPAVAHLQLTDGMQVLKAADVPLPQAGRKEAVAEEFFVQKTSVGILFDNLGRVGKIIRE